MSFHFQDGTYPVGGIDQHLGLGKVIYVSSLYGKDGNPGTVSAPKATIVNALSTLGSSNNTQNRGDYVVCLPGHVETVTTATQLSVTRAGVTLMGIGSGAQRPQILMTTATTATMTVAADAFTMSNMAVVAGIATCVALVTLSSTNMAIDNCHFSENSALSGTMVSAIATGAATSNVADGLVVTNSRFLGASTDNGAIISYTGTNNKFVFTNNYMIAGVNAGTATTPLIAAAAGKNITNVNIVGNQLNRAVTSVSSASIINLPGTNSGMIANNVIGCSVAAIASVVSVMSAPGARFIQNFAVGEDGKSGILVPAADAT